MKPIRHRSDVTVATLFAAAMAAAAHGVAQEDPDLVPRLLQEESLAAARLDAPADFLAQRDLLATHRRAQLQSYSDFPLANHVRPMRTFELSEQEVQAWTNRTIAQHSLEALDARRSLAALVYDELPDALSVGDWIPSDGSTTFFLKVTLPGVTGLGFVVSAESNLPGAAALAYGEAALDVQGPSALQAPGTGSGVLLPPVDGATAYLEVRGLPAEFALGPGAAPPFRVALVVRSPRPPGAQHVVIGETEDGPITPLTECSYTPAVCTQSPTRHATVNLSYCHGTSCWDCSGSLMRDNDASTDIPYILTAGHCDIRSGDLFWITLYDEANTCAGTGLHPWRQQFRAEIQRLGGEYVGSGCSPPDWALLRFNRVGLMQHVPTFLLPKTTMPSATQAVYVFHHPAGELKSYSTGDVSLFQFGHPSTISIAPDFGSYTEPGSSGAPWVDLADNLQFGIHVCSPGCLPVDRTVTRFSYVAPQIQRFLSPMLARPFVASVNIPTTALLGNEVLVRVTAENIGSFTSTDGHIHLAFPHLDASGDNSSVRAGNRSTDLTYLERERNESMFTRDGIQEPMNWVHVECADASWTPGESNFAEVYLRPKQAGPFNVQYRVAMVSQNDYYYNEPPDSVADTIEVDQYWGVEQRTVQVYGPPTGISASDGAFTDRVAVTWTPLTGATSYQVLRNTTHNPPSVAVATVTVASYDDVSATTGVTYYYWIKPCDAGGCGTAGGPDTGFRNSACTYNVTSPDGGETYTKGSTYNVTWSRSGGSCGANVGIDLYKGGVFQSTITGSTPGSSGSFAWAVPGSLPDGGDYRVRVVDLGNGSYWDASNGTFTIQSPATCTYTVTYPNGGETLIKGSTYGVTWTRTGAACGANVRVELYRAGVLNSTIAASTPGAAASLAWTVSTGLVSASDYQVRVMDLGNASFWDQSNANFTLQSAPSTCTYTLLYPNGGEVFAKGTDAVIEWTRTGTACGPLARLDLHDGDTFVRTIAGSTSGSPGSVPWPIPADVPDGTNYRVRITDLANSAYGDSSDTGFTIGSGGSSQCTPGWVLTCGSSDSWRNDGVGSTNVLTDYACDGWNHGNLTGPEYAYTFAPAQGVQATITLDGLSADLDLFVLSSVCTPSNCIAYSEWGGDAPETIVLSAAAGRAYHIVVEGYVGSVSDYTIAVSCVTEELIFKDGFEGSARAPQRGVPGQYSPKR